MFENIVRAIAEGGADAWVIYDFGSTNPAFNRIFGKTFCTRKAFAVIDRHGRRRLVCHDIDRIGLSAMATQEGFETLSYRTWREMEGLLSQVLSGYARIMMDVSENGLLPRASYVDYGTVCSVKRFVHEVIPSADVFQSITAPLSGSSLNLHREAADLIDDIKNRAFERISKDVRDVGCADEFDVQQFICDEFVARGLVADSRPIVAIGSNASSPHYEPTVDRHSKIHPGDLVLIDLWAKKDLPEAVFADVTWMGFVGTSVPPEFKQAFDVVRKAIDASLSFLIAELPKRKVCGYEVDDVASGVLAACGYGDFIKHRTGHSMSVGDSDHGIGVNIDNFESHDTRTIIDGVMFSLEPGIYTPSFGLREEIDVHIEGVVPHVYTPRQEQIVLL